VIHASLVSVLAGATFFCFPSFIMSAPLPPAVPRFVLAAIFAGLIKAVRFSQV
jgi:hypothetical protein